MTHFFLSQVVYQNKDDQVTVVAAGVTLHEALAAAEYLKKGTLPPGLRKISF